MITIDLVVFGTFGTPNGFQQSSLERNKYKTFDLNTNAITIYPNTVVYSLRKEDVLGKKTIAYSVYSFAKEYNSDRQGTFFGSSFVFYDKISDEKQILKNLQDFHQKLVNKYIKDNRLQVGSSDEFTEVTPPNFRNLNANQKPITIENFTATGKQLAVYIANDFNKLPQLLQKSLELLNDYDTIYFTQSIDIANFVKEKGIISITDIAHFDSYIQNYRIKKEEERQSEFKNAIAQLKNEQQRIEKLKADFEQRANNQIIENEKRQNENKKKLEKNEQTIKQTKEQKDSIASKFKTTIQKLINEIQNIQSGKTSTENVQKVIGSIRSEITEISKNISLSGISKISSVEDNKRNEPRHSIDNQAIKPQPPRSKDKESILFYVLAGSIFIVIGIFGTLLFQTMGNNDTPKQQEIQKHQQPEEQFQEENKDNTRLNPPSNAELNVNDCQIVNKEIKPNQNVTDIVKKIFKLNPTHINRYYEHQTSDYEKELIKRNKDCFEEKDSLFTLKEDKKISHIPAYKSEKQ